MFSHATVEQSSVTSRSLAVLVADDAEDVRQSVCRWLGELGHGVTGVSSGNDAIRLIGHQAVDLVITEVILPNGDGLEVITALRKLQPAARIIAYSAGGQYLSGPDCLRVAKGLGAHEVLLKPTTRDDLERAIMRVMANGVADDRAASAAAR